MRVSKRVISLVLLITLVITSLGNNFSSGSAYANSPEKKEKFIVKHQDNERLKAKFFPDEVVLETVTDEVVSDEVVVEDEHNTTTEPAIDITVEETTTGEITTEETSPEETNVEEVLSCEVVTDEITAVEGTISEIQELIADPDIITVEYDSVVTISGDLTPQNLITIGESSINDSTYNGTGVKVAIIDTGIDVDNADLNVKGGVSFVEGTTYDDDHGHGTALAGIVGAKNNGEGIVGIAPEADLYAVKVLDSTGTGYYSDVIKGLEWCINNQMDIVLMSFGSEDYSAILLEIVNEAVANDILMVAAAGNTGSAVEFPAAFNNVVAVGAVNANDELLSYSCYGEEIDITANGIVSEAYNIDNTYTSIEGTSVSAANIAGIATELLGYDSTLSADEVSAILYNSTRPYDNRLGYGNGVISASYVYENRDNTYELNQEDVIYDITKATTTDGEVYISFKHPGYDNQSISVGDKVTVRSGFYDNHEKCVITLYKKGDESNPIDTEIREPIWGLAGDDSEPIYTSNYVTYTTPTMTEAGTYKIRYHCPDNNGSDWDDVFTFTVQSGDGDGSTVDPTLFPDLVPISLDIKDIYGNMPSKYFVGESMRVFVDIKNDSSTKFTGYVDLIFNVEGTKYLSKNVYLSLGAGKEITKEVTTYNSAGYPPSSLWSASSATAINMDVTLKTSEIELSSGNNTFPKTISTDDKPRLEVYKSTFEIPQSYSKAGETVNAKIKVENTGGSESGSFDLVIKKKDGTVIVTKNITNIVNGSAPVFTVPITLDSTYGNYEYRVELTNFTYPNGIGAHTITDYKTFEVGGDHNEDSNDTHAGAVLIDKTTGGLYEVLGGWRKYEDVQSYLHQGDIDWYKIEVKDEDTFLLVSLVSPYLKGSYDENYIVELYKEGNYTSGDAVAQSISTYERNYFRYEIESAGTYYIKVLPKSISNDHSVEYGYTLEVGIESLRNNYGSEAVGWQTKDDDDNPYLTAFPIEFKMGSGMDNVWGTINGKDIKYEDFMSDFVVDSYMGYNGYILEEINIYEDSAFDIWNDATINGAPSKLFSLDSNSQHTMFIEPRTDDVGGWCRVSGGVVTIAYNNHKMDQSNISMPKTFAHDYEFFKSIIAHELGHAIGLRDLYVNSGHGYLDENGLTIDNTDKLMYGYNNLWTISAPDYLSPKDIEGLETIQGWSVPTANVGESVIFTSYSGYSEAQLFTEADVIVRLTISDVEEVAGTGMPYSTVTGNVVEYYKDVEQAYSDSISFIQEGTSTDIVYSNRLLEVDDEVILFLKSDENNEYYIMGGPQGRYDISESFDNLIIENHLASYVDDELFFVDGEKCQNTSVELDEFIEELQETVYLSKPEISYSISGNKSLYNWYNEPITVYFSATDDMHEIVQVSTPVILSSEGANQTVTGTATNSIGQSSELLVENINIDMTKPNVRVLETSAKTNQWYNESIQINIDITEELSGLSSVEYQIYDIADYDLDKFSSALDELLEINEEGVWYLTTQANDKANNNATQTFGPFMVDKTAPMIEYTGLLECLMDADYDISYLADDNLSGIDSEVVYIDGVEVEQHTYKFSSPGLHEIVIEVLDNAGNKTVLSKTLNVLLPISVSIDPNSLNLESGKNGKSQITVELTFPEGYDIAMIIADSISLNGSAYSESSDKYGYVKNPISYDEDGNAVYMVKFYRSDLTNILVEGENQLSLRGKTRDFDFIWQGTVFVK